MKDEEKKKILIQLVQASPYANATKVDTTTYYKVPFTEALDLVRQRKVYLQAGYAYVPSDELVSIVTSMFRAHLSLALAVFLEKKSSRLLKPTFMLNYFISMLAYHAITS